MSKHSKAKYWRISVWTIAIGLIGLLCGCYEPIEGCLDVNATNFDLDADRACSDCCETPSVVLELQHRVIVSDSVINRFRLQDSIYRDASGQPFRFQNISFYISDFKFIDLNGNAFGVADEVTFQVFQDGGGSTRSETLEDNFALISPAATPIDTLGKIAQTGTFDRIRFTIGLDPPASDADPASFSIDHPLNDSIMWRNPTDGYSHARILFFRDTIAADTIPEELLFAPPQAALHLELPIGQPFTLDPGFNVKVTLLIDYQSWFEDIPDIKNMPVEQLLPIIIDGIAPSFYLTAIEIQSG